MNRIKQFLQSDLSAPVAFLVIGLLSFGLLIPNLGFYMDDWPYVFYAKLLGIGGLREMLIYDSRPNAAWLYMFAFRMLGFSPVKWHIFALFMRLLTVTTFWLFLRLMWPERKREAIAISLLFAVFPFFMLQPFAVGSTHHWFGFAVFNTSLILMVKAFQETSPRKWIFLTLSMSLEGVHLFTSEYFAGLELIRIAIFWILITRTEKKLMYLILNWIPYALVLAVFFYWRVVLYQNPEGVTRNEPVILIQLMKEPFKAMQFLFTAFVTDAISVLTLGWGQAFDVSLLNFSSPFVLFKLFVIFVGGISMYLYLHGLHSTSTEPDDGNVHIGSTLLAIFAFMTGGLPIWFIGRSIVESKNLLSASRFGIPSMFGAALLNFLFTEYFIPNKNKRSLLLSILLALAINFHLDNTHEFQYSWEKQERFIQQLIWRVPSIEPGTALLTDQEVMGVMGEYAVSFSINTAYQMQDFGNTPPYWYFPFYYTNPNIDELLQGSTLEYTKLSMQFNGNSKQMLLLDFNPEMQRCLWVLQPQDTNLRLVSTDVRKLAAGSNINLIQQIDPEPSPSTEIYGVTNTQTWCYYFQKADLARQFGEWDKIVQLWNEAQTNGERPDNGFEYIPFIEGFGHTGNWEKVKEMTKFANRVSAGLEPSLCGALERLNESVPGSAEKESTLQSLNEDLSCGLFK